MIDGSILHFLPIDVNMQIVNRNNIVGQGSYGKIMKCCISRVDFISQSETYCCKIYNITTNRDPIANLEKEDVACPLFHHGLVKVFLIHSIKSKSYMCWWNVGSWVSIYKKLQKN
jgi:TPP-dependent trihydroxycyclohexane-1,2-dione (THcHDO) dehydratase